MKKGYLILSDGTTYEGTLRGAACEGAACEGAACKGAACEGAAIGELVFTTAMCGYMETLTDPSYYGQIILQTFPLIGNYGVIGPDAESKKIYASGYVVRELCDAPSNFRSEGALDGYLAKQGITVLTGVDTREVTRHLRSRGVMPAAITDTPVPPASLAGFAVRNAVPSVSTGETYVTGTPGGHPRVALLDYGAKAHIETCLAQRGCEVTILPYDTPAADIQNGGFDGVMLSNGPGDPAENTACIKEIAKLLGNIPIFGICLGHQMLALAAGAGTLKLPYGHRGANQPVKSLRSGKVYITTQNHGYAVDPEKTGAGVPSFVNANDGTNEGLDYPGKRAFSVQFHPEAAAGPHDTGYLFDRFISLMEGKGDASE